MKIETKIIDERLIAPGMLGYATPGSAAIDMRACNMLGTAPFQEFTIYPGEQVQFGAGVAFWMQGEDGMRLPVAGLLIPRSGLGSKGMRLANTVGLIDTDFQGQVLMTVQWHGSDPLPIKSFDRIAQLMIVPYIKAELVFVPEFSNKTERADGGFGSTGSN